MVDSIVPLENIESRIFLIRGHKVMIDADLANIYGVTTKRLNEQIKRNRDRFPEDFMFQLTKEEKDEVVANCDHLKKLKYSPVLPNAFTEHGAIMIATILNSPVAVQASIHVVRALSNSDRYLPPTKNFLNGLMNLKRNMMPSLRWSLMPSVN